MFSRPILLFALTLQAFATVNAANDLDKWNSDRGKVVRSAMKEKLATTTYRELPNHVDSSYSSTANGGKVLRQLETSAEIKGSRVGTTINALKQVDKYAAAKKFGSEFGKGALRFGVAGILIDQAMQEMLDGIGWIIDTSGQVQKKNPEANSEDALKNTSPKIYQNQTFSITKSYSHESACSKYKPTNNDYKDISAVAVFQNNKPSCYYTQYSKNTGKVYNGYVDLNVSANPDYKPDAEPPPSHIDVLEPEMIEKIRDYFEDPQSPASKDLLIEDSLKPKGKAKIAWSDDPASEKTILSDNKTTAEKVLNSDNPVADGLTKDTPKISDPTQIESETTTNTETNTNVNENTVTNPDGSTTTTGTNTSNTTNTTSNKLEIAPFCDYAKKLCDWLDWTKEEPDEEEKKEEEEINDRGIFDRVFDLDFSLGGECPSNMSWSMKDNGVLVDTFEIDLQWACMFFTAIGYALVFLSNCLGIWIMYEVAARKELKV